MANLATALFFGWYHIGNEELFATPVPSIVAQGAVAASTVVSGPFVCGGLELD